MDEKDDFVLEGRGRNGQFMIDSTDVFINQTLSGPRMDISMSSGRIGGSPPIRIEDTLEDITAYFEAIHQPIGQAMEKVRKHPGGSFFLTVTKKGEVRQ